jgi:hypothetical protein
VLQSLALDEKRSFLQFATGCDRAPVAGLKALRLLIQVSSVRRTKHQYLGFIHHDSVMLYPVKYQNSVK